MDEEMTTNGPTNRLEQKIDALAQIVDRRLGSVEEKVGSVEEKVGSLEEKIGSLEEKIGTVDGKVDTLAAEMRAGFKRVDERLAGVEGRLTGVEGQLTDVQDRLIRAEILARDTNALCKNIWDSKISLERKMDEGFAEAKREREQGFELVHKAVKYWGQKVADLETAPVRRTTKRRR
jgi:chromosome segregation ATPase